MKLFGIELFPPFCRVEPIQTECTFLGITLPCDLPLTPLEDGNVNFLLGQEEGHLWVFVSLFFFIGLYALSYAQKPWNIHKDSMKLITALYSAETAWFALFRFYFGLGRPLIVGAALHNLFEWWIVIHLASGITATNVMSFSTMAVFWIFFVVGIAVMLPSLAGAFIFEQSTGILLDFAMPLMFLNMYVFAEDREARDFYFKPALAHWLHILFTILPLVFANFHVGFISWYNSFYLETAIYLSAPMTHILYCLWSWDYDKLRADKLTVKNESTNDDGLIPEKYRIKNVKRYLITGFLLGQFFLVFVPFGIMGQCDEQADCLPDGIITGTSVATVKEGSAYAFEDLVANSKLVENARAFEGNVHYELVKSVQGSNDYRFIEKWSSQEALQNWLNTGTPAKLFTGEPMKGVLESGALHDLNGYITPTSSSCRSYDSGRVSFSVNQKCKVVWKDIGNWSNCNWIKGCEYVEVKPNPDGSSTPYRELHFENGVIVGTIQLFIIDEKREMKYEIYKIPEATAGYTGHIKLNDGTRGGCDVEYKFTVPRGKGKMTGAQIYEDFYGSRVPYLKKLYS